MAWYRLFTIYYEKTKEICKNKYDVDDYWINASLAECCLVIGDEEGYRKYQEIANLCNLANLEQMKWKQKKTDKQLTIIKKLINELTH